LFQASLIFSASPGRIRLCSSGSVEYARLTYPPYDAPLMEAYGGRFESLYAIFHPFVNVPEDLSWKATGQYPSYAQILSQGSKCTWAAVAAQTGIPTCSKMNQALLTSIRSLRDEFCDFPASEALQNHLKSHAVWMPGDGVFEPLLERDFLDAFEVADLQELIFVPEFPQADPVQKLDVGKLKRREESFPDRGSLVAPDGSFLFTVDWDSFFTLFYGPRDFVAEVVRRRNLEGFFATPTTDRSWYNYSLGCCVVTLAPDGWPAV
jgi:hypothetical protein